MGAVRRRGRHRRHGPAQSGGEPGCDAAWIARGDARVRAGARRARADLRAVRGVGRRQQPPSHARLRRVRVLHPADPGARGSRSPRGRDERTRGSRRPVDARPSERPPRMHRLRHVQDACRAGGSEMRTARSRSSARGSPIATARCTRTSCSPRTRSCRSASGTACRTGRGTRSTTFGARSRRSRRSPVRSVASDAQGGGRREPRPTARPHLSARDGGRREGHLRADRHVRAR